MDNRRFPAGAPIADGKTAFPYQAINGSYPGMCYPGQDMVMPYGQCGGSANVPFNEQCAVAQQVAQAPANMSYGFGSQAHQYMQHYRQQAHIMQAYSNAQQQNRVTNPQHIADSIYNMAAHAHNYQQHQTPQLPQAHNSYSPGSGGHNILSVRTGQSPANSIHSPAGSTHSLGERPLLSPHIQSNAQIYNYHQANQHGTPRHQSAQPQQHVSNMNYYSNNNHPTPAVNGCMNSELEHRRSIERLAAISNQPDQFNHNQEVSSPIRTNEVGQYFQPSVTVANSPSVSNNMMMPAPVTVCQRSATAPSHNQQDRPSSKLATEVVSPPSASNQPISQSKLSSVSSPGDLETLPNNSFVELSSAPLREHSNSVLQELELLDDESKPKEMAADSGIDSEQVDKDNDEEHDTSTTSNKSENSPQLPKTSDLTDDNSFLLTEGNENEGTNASELHNDSDISPVKVDKGLSLSSKEAGQLVSSPTDDTQNKSLHSRIEQASSGHESEPISPPQVSSHRSATGAISAAPDSPANPHNHMEYDKMGEEELRHDNSVQPSDLNESFSSQMSSSLGSSGSGAQMLGDESRLPPRKRKHKLSEHTRSLKALMPLKKRGRPSKETIRLREAAKLVETQELSEAALTADLGALLPQTVKERNSSVSSASKVKKPVHSGNLLQSPKLNLIAKDEHSLGFTPLGQPMDISGSDANFIVQSGNKPGLPFQPKSNAVLVSPPRKPKASVNEMEKALMRVVSSDVTGEILFTGKKKRGRPPGSKNRKTRLLDQRARSNSTGSSGKGQLKMASSENGPRQVECGKESNNNSVKPSASNSVSKSTLSQSHKLSLSVQNRTKSLHHRKRESLSPKGGSNAIELKLPVSTDQWVCTFCQHISNYRDMGDLFGGYNIQPGCPVVAKVSHRKTPDSRLQQFDKSSRPNEIWFHERCIVWSPGVYMLAGKLYGVYEAVTAAFQTTCSSCKKKGAILGCFCKGCSQRYHVHCAEQAECVLNEENFSMLCTKHKDRKIVLI